MSNKPSADNSHLTNKPAVLLIHGFSENNHIWDHQLAALREQFNVIVPDLPGTGSTPITTPLSIESMAEYVYGLLQSAGISRATVIGHSMGGYIALALAEKYPSLLQGLGLFHSTATADTEEKKEARRKSINMIEKYGNEAFVKQTMPNMFSPAYKKQHPEQIESYIQMCLQCPQATQIAYYEAMIQRPDRTAVLSSVSIPVLFVIGKDDTAVPMQNVLPQVSLPRISSIHIFEDTGHMGMWEIPAASQQLLEQFILFCQHY
ncbi:alpha/beta fold hydrolase [Chitinophaga rhizophila]|uniref:Alpha/beta hydrolase n=1 Tax=Chitinophaga rhizophila TaxID=2866212 RepID=A0ABS7GFK2_9BACT|nr:alpha/beta hydrolase [Chitinophaga rhizophila]MBW8685442.1 alpha/beta hydrolase [Chitinophaga rhizophila]